MMTANITDIKRFAVHDGEGIRTTVFFKGCSLRCVWCHNPEGLISDHQLAFYSHKCVSCGECAKTCMAHTLRGGIHTLDRAACMVCEKCAELCPTDALKVYGKIMTVDEIFSIIIKDKEFYKSSGGGVTLSGGECLMQADASAELLKICCDNGINTAVDTSGYASRQALDKVIPYTGTFLFDIKAYDENVHIKCTGVSNSLILENLCYLDNIGAKIEIRVPYVPTYNDGELEKISEFVNTLQNVIRVRILPYHNLAGSKYGALGLKNTLPNVIIPTEEECKRLSKKYFKFPD